MKEVSLSDVSRINPPKRAGLSRDLLCSFVPMEYVDDISGTIAQASVRSVGDVEKGYTPFLNGDVIFAKITPCMENGKCAIAQGMMNGVGFGSTEFHVLRATQDVLPEWIYYFLRQEKIRQQATRWFRGTAGQQRVPSDFLDQLKLPLPTIPEQRRIVAILAKADRLRRLRRTVRQLGETYLQSVFMEMFGEPTRNENGWNVTSLGSIVKINPPGRSKGTPNQPASFLPMTLVDSSAIFTDNLDIKKYNDVSVGYTYFEDGDVLFAKITPCMENGNIVIARNLLNGFGFGSTEFHVIRPNEEANSFWLYGLVKRMEFREQAKRWFRGTAGQQRVPNDFLETFKVSLPPIHIQNRYANIVRRYDQLGSQQREAERQAEMLFQSLLQRTFAGEV